ncbi:DNA-binding transcription factor [Emydomyces testavorans]|uniref:DNA-binding transcription factor n=1 Tax=Emydomyces testavorans TaxID=2070801 RepID=A0AAF0IEV4_9EURO|nr:DNA-binding transcription factor [Emydomyces testavorans]
MDVPRGRSPSMTGDKNPNVNHSDSANPTAQQYHDQLATLGLAPALSASNLPSSPSLFPSSNPATCETDAYAINNTSFIPDSIALDNNLLHANVPADPSFNHSQQYPQPFEDSFMQQFEPSSALKTDQGHNHISDLPSDQMTFDAFSMYSHSRPTPDFASSFMLDPQLAHSSPHLNQSVNPADLSRMSSPHNPTPPHLVPPESHTSPRPTSPVSSPPTHYTPQHSRNTSLDPATAAYIAGHGHSDWQGLLGNPSFQSHRRAPSEHSDVSSVSHSPYLPQENAFEFTENNHSPLLMAQPDPLLYENALGIGSFTISDQEQAFSPAHSPYNMSPRIMPQQPGGEAVPENAFLTSQTLHNSFVSASSDAYTLKTDTMGPPFLSQNSPNEMGQVARMTPPVISVEFAPPSRTPTFETANKGEGGKDTLSPPISRRGRSKSDPFAQSMPRSSSAGALNTPFPNVPHDPRSLSPFPRSTGTLSTPSSREVSPASKSRRQSTSSIDSRNYILDLAIPQRPGFNSGSSKTGQKHPATFQCSLCPKRFTRAYNLRSHLRTHTDERPFVCTVCGKAFARQHDRKRHEGLHSGEKKFVCRGDLSRGDQWGCGRRFARADALGRHFRSEAGRVCIKPLLDEEAWERERTSLGQQDQQQQQQQITGHLQPVPQPVTIQGMDGQRTAFTLPAALLAQYPALQTLQWDQIATQADDSSEFRGDGGRSSFDASSGGEFGFADDDETGTSSGYASRPGMTHTSSSQDQLLGINPGPGGSGWHPHAGGWTGEYDGAR